MIYGLSGKTISSGQDFLVLQSGGLSFKIFTHRRLLDKIPRTGGELSLFTHLHVREDALELYGFQTEEELRFFELLISVSGVGPKSALGIMGIAHLEELSAAIKENRPDLLTRVSGIGRKTAERVIVELKSKVGGVRSASTVQEMDSDADVLEALSRLGYRREEIKAALDKVDKSKKSVEERLKEALKILGRR